MASAMVRSELLRHLQESSKVRRPPVATELLGHIRKTLKFASWLGGVPFTLEDERHLRLVPWKLAYSGLCASLVLLMSSYVAYESNPLINRSLFSKFIFYLQAIPFSFTALANIFCVTVFRGRIETVVQKFVEVEKVLSSLEAKHKVHYTVFFGIALQMFTVINASAGVLVMWSAHPSTVVMFMLYPYAYCYLFGYLELFVFLVDSLRYYLEVVVRQASSREVVLVRLCAVHDILADARACIQRVYGFPVLCITFCSFLFINISIFISIKNTLTSEILIFFTGVVTGFAPVLRVVYSCEKATRKGNEFYSVVLKIMKADRSCKLLDNVYLSGHLTKKKSFVFNAAGFFDMDFKFVGRMIAATTTFTVILVQMGKDF